MKEIRLHLEKQITKWRHILNSHYETDSKKSLEDYAVGRLTAYIELLVIIKDHESNRKEEESRRITKQVQTNDGEA
tara:strand:+ start:168 stop:395 length:228 start_codon:yes stop_codon:yes gene_type:complete